MYSYANNSPATLADPAGLKPPIGGIIEAYSLMTSAQESAQSATQSASDLWALMLIRAELFNQGKLQDPGYAIDVTDQALGIIFGDKLLGLAIEAYFAKKAVGGAVIGAGKGGRRPKAKFVRKIECGEKIEDLVAEIKGLQYSTGVEHAVVSLTDGSRHIVSGGKTGMTLPGNTRTLFAHTHPYDKLSNFRPSPEDFEALLGLKHYNEKGQMRSYFYEHGRQIKFYRTDPR